MTESNFGGRDVSKSWITSVCGHPLTESWTQGQRRQLLRLCPAGGDQPHPRLGGLVPLCSALQNCFCLAPMIPAVYETLFHCLKLFLNPFLLLSLIPHPNIYKDMWIIHIHWFGSGYSFLYGLGTYDLVYAPSYIPNLFYLTVFWHDFWTLVMYIDNLTGTVEVCAFFLSLSAVISNHGFSNTKENNCSHMDLFKTLMN